MGDLIENINYYKNVTITEEERKDRLQNVYFFGSGIFLSQLGCILFINPFFFYASKIGMKLFF